MYYALYRKSRHEERHACVHACVCVRACRANRSRGDFLNLGNGRAMSALFLYPLSIAVDHGCRLSSSLHAFASSIMAHRPRNRRQSRVQRQTLSIGGISEILYILVSK